MDASALDRVLDCHNAYGAQIAFPATETLDAAREELAALRARVEDLEMIARAALNGGLRRSGGGSGAGDYRHAWPWWYRTEDTEALAAHGGYGNGMSRLRDDGTGLPLLTDAARAALRTHTEGT